MRYRLRIKMPANGTIAGITNAWTAVSPGRTILASADARGRPWWYANRRVARPNLVLASASIA